MTAIYMDDPRAAADQVAIRICNIVITAYRAEVDLQKQLHVALAAHYPLMREHRISERDRVDFLVKCEGFKVAVEVKIQGARSPVLRQLGRYAANSQVDAIVLASTRRTLLHAMPHEIHHTPVAVALIGGVGSLA